MDNVDFMKEETRSGKSNSKEKLQLNMNSVDLFHNKNKSTVCFIISLSFLMWELKVDQLCCHSADHATSFHSVHFLISQTWTVLLDRNDEHIKL